ncbi:MAG: FAD-dependent oxidoreductase [Candidatus Moranbacteria bacterium]|nr:FAD-dependent oxidoreductase [Candidatus Moranbacteria bacterium]
MAERKDLIILGAGPAGLTASIYASRFKIDHLVLGEEPGGYMNESHKIENYPGIPSIAGTELGQKMREHAESLGSLISQEKISSLSSNKEGLFSIKTRKETHFAKKVILATGTVFRKLNVPGEDELAGKGVSYCATCDAPFFKDKKVAVVGGGNSALGAAMLLSQYAREVVIFYRADKLRAVPAYIEQTKKRGNIKTAPETNVTQIKGTNKVEQLALDNEYEKEREPSFDGIFIEIGSVPDTGYLENLEIEKDERGYIKTKADQLTSVQSLYAAGDITTNSNGFRQIITAASEGAIAANAVYQELN